MKNGTITNNEMREQKTRDIEMLHKAIAKDERKHKQPLRINPYTTIMVTQEKRTKRYARQYAEKIGATYTEQ